MKIYKHLWKKKRKIPCKYPPSTMQVPCKLPPKYPPSTPQVPPKYPPSTPQVTSQVTPQVTSQVTPQVKELLKVFEGLHNREEIQNRLELADRKCFRVNYLNPAIEQGFVALTIPDKPTSSKQQYYLTDKGKEFLKTLK